MTRLDVTAAAKVRLAAILAKPHGHRVGVLGLGVAGKAMALLLAKRGALVVGVDRRAELVSAELTQAGIELRLGPTGPMTFADVELVVLSPGADPAQEAVAHAVAKGVPVCGELELVQPLPARVAAITGTNGKSTTTALLGALVKGMGQAAFVGGNLGDPIAGWLLQDKPADVAVVELSSFQLETAYSFRADVSVMLNITPDHFDRYPDVASYAATKERLLENMDAKGIAILNADDQSVVAMARSVRGSIYWFSTLQESLPGDGAYLDGDTLVPVGSLATLGRLDLRHPRLFGRHNRENALAAMLALAGLGLWGPHNGDLVRASYVGFCGLEHRLELVGEVNGVRFINDSKATNDDAAAVALAAMDRPVVLLAGGRDKGAGYERLVAAARTKVHAVVAFGEAQALIAKAFATHPGLVLCQGMREAFLRALTLAKPGDVVLLAPACSSYDEFTDYKHRGREFKRWVQALSGGNA